jgi:predicted negative regulator of RcsB-dependent stress response
LIRFVSSITVALLFAFRLAAAEQNQLDSSENLFTVLAALNAAGYDTDIDSPGNHPLRAQVRKYVADQKPPVLSEIRSFYKDHPGVGPYLSLALSLTPAPEFAFRTRTVDIPPDAYALAKFIPLLTRFYLEAKIGPLWTRLQPAHNAAIEAYHEPVSRIALTVNSYFRSSTAGYLGRRFIVYIDLLGAPEQVHSRSYGDDYFVIATNAKEPHVTEIRHAFLHYLVEPLVAKYGLALMKKASLSDYAAPAPALDESYKNDFVLLVSECMIKAIETRLDHKPEMVNQALHDGFILTPFFAEQLITYEKEPVAMRLYFPDILKALDTKREGQRLANVTFTPKQKAAERPTQVVEKQTVSQALRTVEQAEKLYQAQQYEEAKNLLLKALEQPGDTADHARAYYNLGLIALRAKNPEMAEKLFQKTIESGADPFAQAWSLVYLGRLSGLSGDRAQAIKYYNLALAVKDASDEAHRAAEKGIENSNKQQ